MALLGAGAFGFWKYKQHAKEKEAAAKKVSDLGTGPQQTLVRVQKTRVTRVYRRERYVGELAALQVVELGPRAAGRLVSVKKQLNDAVKKGEVVAKVDDLEIEKQIAEAQTAVVVAKAQVERAQADLERAKAELGRAQVEVSRTEQEANRKRPLFKQQLVTLQEMDNLDAAVTAARSSVTTAESGVTVAKSSISVARAQVKQAEARLPMLKVQIANTRVVVPFAGRINKRYIEPGAMVAIGTPIYQIVTDQKVIARFKVPERDLGELPVGKEVALDLEAYPKERFKGTVVRVAPSVDALTRTASAEAETEALDGKLKPGMFARVEVLWSVMENVTLAPQRALVRPPDDPQGQPGVYVHKAGIARFVKVQTGLEQGDEIEVKGLERDVEVIIEGQHGLKSGGAVMIAQPPGARPAGMAVQLNAPAPAAGTAPSATPPAASPAAAPTAAPASPVVPAAPASPVAPTAPAAAAPSKS